MQLWSLNILGVSELVVQLVTNQRMKTSEVKLEWSRSQVTATD